MSIRWATLIAEDDGRISLHRVRNWDARLDAMALVAAVLVAPMTGGQVADAIYGKFHSDKIQQGDARGRRSTD
jgi:hypothetical protein